MIIHHNSKKKHLKQNNDGTCSFLNLSKNLFVLTTALCVRATVFYVLRADNEQHGYVKLSQEWNEKRQ